MDTIKEDGEEAIPGSPTGSPSIQRLMNTSCMMPPTLTNDTEYPSVYESDVVEMPLLLSGLQMSALEQAAHHRGLTAAGMVRQLLREFMAAQPMRTA